MNKVIKVVVLVFSAVRLSSSELWECVSHQRTVFRCVTSKNTIKTNTTLLNISQRWQSKLSINCELQYLQRPGVLTCNSSPFPLTHFPLIYFALRNPLIPINSLWGWGKLNLKWIFVFVFSHSHQTWKIRDEALSCNLSSLLVSSETRALSYQ